MLKTLLTILTGLLITGCSNQVSKDVLKLGEIKNSTEPQRIDLKLEGQKFWELRIGNHEDIELLKKLTISVSVINNNHFNLQYMIYGKDEVSKPYPTNSETILFQGQLDQLFENREPIGIYSSKESPTLAKLIITINPNPLKFQNPIEIFAVFNRPSI